MPLGIQHTLRHALSLPCGNVLQMPLICARKLFHHLTIRVSGDDRHGAGLLNLFLADRTSATAHSTTDCAFQSPSRAGLLIAASSHSLESGGLPVLDHAA